jgi:ectoine hydroxylase-related dioxygenase (phytanoyl-CoA dioxygenase family)
MPQEIIDQDTSNKVPVTMDPGDVLVFHSFLMHMSTDNVADYSRTAMLLHYARAGTKPVNADVGARLSHVNLHPRRSVLRRQRLLLSERKIHGQPSYLFMFASGRLVWFEIVAGRQHHLNRQSYPGGSSC